MRITSYLSAPPLSKLKKRGALALLLISAIALTAYGGSATSSTSGSNSLSIEQQVARGIGRAATHVNRGPGSVTQSSTKGDVVNFDVSYTDPELSISGSKMNSAGEIEEISSDGDDVMVTSSGADNNDGVVDFYDKKRRILVKTNTDYDSTITGGDTDYLIGVWVVSPDNSLSTGQFEYAVFVDGNNPFMQDNIEGLTGTATYEGTAQGIFTGPINTDAIDAEERGREAYANIDPIPRE